MTDAPKPTLTEAEQVEALAAVLDPDVFGDDKPKSSAHAALIQWAARRFMATEKAERAIAAGWMSPEEAKARVAAARREALLEAHAEIKRAEDEADDLTPWRLGWKQGCGFGAEVVRQYATGERPFAWEAQRVRAALAEPERDEEGR